MTPVASFYAQQAVEKSFKAFLEEKEIAFRKIHDVVTLYGMLSDDLAALDMEPLKDSSMIFTLIHVIPGNWVCCQMENPVLVMPVNSTNLRNRFTRSSKN